MISNDKIKKEPEVAIKYSYIKDRERPAEVFEAIGLYIKTYENLTQLLASALGMEEDIPLKLNSVISGSILSKLSALPNSINSSFESIIFESSERLVEELISSDETNTEADVDSLAEALESELSKCFPNTLLPPYVDRQKLAVVLESLSNANKRVAEGEAVSISTNNEIKETVINTSWRFTGDAKKMFQGKIEYFEHEDILTTSVAVFEGKSVWVFKSVKTGTKYNAKIDDEVWLKRYQAGLERRIGPKDLIVVDIKYEKHGPREGGDNFEIKKAKITKIKNVVRGHGYKNEQKI